MRRPLTVTAAAVLVAVALSGCTAGGGSTGGSAAGGTAAGSSVDLQAGQGRVPAAASGGSAAGAAAPADRAIVTTGSLRLITDHPITVADRVERLAEQAGGRVSRSTEDPGARASAQLVLRIPAAAFDGALAAIRRQGEARDVSIGATDVTARVTDYRVRIANLRASITRLQQLLGRADSSSALVTIESALTERQTSLEQLLAQQRDLADQVSLATLTVSVVTPAAAPKQGPGDFAAGVAAGAQSLARFATAALIGFGVALPWLVVLAALGGAGLLVRRVLRRRATTTSA